MSGELAAIAAGASPSLGDRAVEQPTEVLAIGDGDEGGPVDNLDDNGGEIEQRFVRLDHGGSEEQEGRDEVDREENLEPRAGDDREDQVVRLVVSSTVDCQLLTG